MKTHFILLLSIVLYSGVIAQNVNPYMKGYILKNDDTRVEGFIGSKEPGAIESISFKKNETDKDVYIYYASEIKGFGKDNEPFQRSYLNNGSSELWFFAEVLVEGHLSLFVRNNIFFLRKDGDPAFIHLGTSRQFHKDLQTLMKEFAYLKAKAMKTKAEKASLSEIVNEYNYYVDHPELKYDGLPKQVSVGLMGGIDYSPANFEDITESAPQFLAFKNLRDLSLLQYGLNLTLRKNTVSKLVGVYTGVYYSAAKYVQNNSHKITGTGDFTESNYLNLSFQEVKIPVGLEFRQASKNSFPVHFKIGVVLPIVTNANFDLVRYAESPMGEIYYESKIALHSISKRLAVQAGFGVEHAFVKKTRLRLEITCGVGSIKVTTANGTESSSGRSESYALMAGFIF